MSEQQDRVRAAATALLDASNARQRIADLREMEASGYDMDYAFGNKNNFAVRWRDVAALIDALDATTQEASDAQ